MVLASDDLATRQAVKVILRQYDQSVELVARVADLLNRDPAHPPSRIILDSRLEMEDPFRLLETLFRTFGKQNTEVFLLTHEQDASVSPDPTRLGAAKMWMGGLADLEAQFRSGGGLERLDKPLRADPIRLAGEDEFMAVFLHAPIPIYLIDTQGRVRRANRARNPHPEETGEEYRRLGYLLGCREAADHGRCGDAPSCASCALHRVLQETIREERCFHRQEIALNVAGKNGETEHLHVLASTTPLWIGAEQMILLFLEDVTELRRSQERLAEFNRDLEAKVEQRTAQVRALLEQKKEFIRQLGHDLRTPLTPLVALLPKFRSSLTDGREREMLEVIIHNTEYIHQLVNKTLDLMVLENDRLAPNFQTLDLRVETNNVLADFAPVLKEKGCTVVNHIEASLPLEADAVQFKELLLNLLSNAVKFSPPGGRIVLGASARDGEVTLSVADTGVGMTPEQMARAFDEFYKADASRHDRTSLGLGLSICRRIVENHRGRIRVESPGLGKGTTVFVTIPARPSGATAQGEKQP